MAIKNFLLASSRTDTGALNENFVSTELVKKRYTIRYWRTKSKTEVDFIIEDRGDVIPLEVKTTLSKPSVLRSFRSFLDKYSPSRGFITSLQLYDEIRVNDIPVKMVPHWYFDPHGG
jgi:predicted AAA+ superfamily ATPase